MNDQFPDAKPFPGQAAAPEAVGSQMGHNQPPPAEQVMIDFNSMVDELSGFRKRIEDLHGIGDRATCTNDTQAAACGDTVKQLRAAISTLNDIHKEVKAPFLAATSAVDAERKKLVDMLTGEKNKVEGKQNQYLRDKEEARRKKEREEQAERDRIEREEREAEEAAHKQRMADIEAGKPVAAPPPPPPPPAPVAAPERSEELIRGDHATVGTTKEWVSKVTNYELAAIEVLDDPKVEEAIAAACQRRVRAGVRKLAGVDIWEQIKATNR